MLPVDLLVSAYASGWFPMAVAEGEIRWFSPDPRGIIPLDTFHVPRRLRRVLRAGGFTIEINRRFEEVIRACAAADRGDDGGTWIDGEILESYCALHEAGYAHSVEAWQNGRLAGGLYGVALGGAFFGESMFHRVTDASKVALVALVERLRARGFTLLDTQWTTAHLEQFGAVEIPRARYVALLEQALQVEAHFV
ncbi:MAG TPA: leucyl/phenylalanyl-tRNA--protein transferase [Vicinamibacterales bacterium]|nr:leucyl/phenylalanyl-tRNA--protein transferase [Vicinamibacterales bacterium]